MKNFAIAAVITSVLVLASCATSGNPALAHLSQATLDQHLVKGKSTKADVLAYLGPASSSMKMADTNVETWAYNYSSAQSTGTTFIPITGLSKGGETKHTTVLTIIFNSDGIVLRDSLSNLSNTTVIGH